MAESFSGGRRLCSGGALFLPRGVLTQGSLLQQVQVAGEELFAERVVQMEGHAMATHVVVSLGPAVAESLVGPTVLHNACCVRHTCLLFTCSLTVD